jgi:hypothetical protein
VTIGDGGPATGGKANILEEKWAESERRYHEQRRLDLCRRWREYHEAQALRIERLAAQLIQDHRSKARALQSSVEGEGHQGPSVEESAKLEASSVGEEEDAGEAR